MYTIKINYKTGGSFHSEEREDKIGCCWKSKELARKGLQAIKEHHAVYRSKGFRDTRSDKTKNKEASKFDWFDTTEVAGFSYPEYNLLLEVDDGTKQRIAVFWIGYFEALHGAEIVAENEDKDSFTV